MTLHNIAMGCLAVYLILVGVGGLFHIAVPILLTAILALVAGILLLIVTLRSTP